MILAGLDGAVTIKAMPRTVDRLAFRDLDGDRAQYRHIAFSCLVTHALARTCMSVYMPVHTSMTQVLGAR